VERSLDLSLLTAALGGRSGLPSAQELQELMAQMEVQLFLRRPALDPQLLESAWYLHGIASVHHARERYTPQRQRQAFAVSSHIFDLALQQDGWSPQDQLSLGFAASIGYRRGGRDPNATAIMNRLRGLIVLDLPVTAHVTTLPLEAGLAFLGFQTRSLFTWFGTWNRQLAALARQSALPDLGSTILGPAQLTVLGADDLLTFFADGNRDILERGRARLLRVINLDGVPEDLNARWVAAHLLALSDEAYAGSLWNPQVIPPSVPGLVRRAFTVGTPAVLTLWEPQRDLLTGDRTPFDPDIRRMVLAVPTSGGKTLLAQLLAVEQLERTGCAVCYVAPTRSLCREVRQAMSSRVRILQKETGADRPDFLSGLYNGSELLDYLDPGPPPDVEVMTPERLANLLRHDAQRVLDRFGMFIFDEAQHLKESGRGFVLESSIAMLDYLTGDTDHRIVLISAAMGNAGAIASWISRVGEAPLLHESAWRGPRRLHAVFTTDARWENTTVRQIKVTKSTKWPYRHTTELGGLIRLRLADGKTTRLTTNEDTGWRLVRKAKSADQRPPETEKDSASTRQYKIAADMIGLLGHAGSVLVVASTRGQAQQLAASLAEAGQEHPALAATIDFVRGQLGSDHPLVEALLGGVGFHHAGLPTEVQEALEQAVRGDILPYLTCTSTLTDGINLPVRTVVIYDTPYDGQPDDVQLRGARLVNAIGRAGRAGKETEGWIVLTRAAAPSERDFTDLDPDADALAVTSSLTTHDALEELAALEQQLRADEDAIFRDQGHATANFIGFVWLMLTVEEERGTEPDELDVADIVDSTLAAIQSPPARRGCLRVARAVQRRYLAADPTARRRWPRTGTSVGSARTIDHLASRIVAAIVSRAQRGEDDDLSDPEFLLRFPLVLKTLLELSEAPKWRFRTTTRGADIDSDPAPVLRDWLRGVQLAQLAEKHLAAATTASWRIEQMVDAVASHFEHYLSWTIGAVIELVNLQLADRGISEPLCPELGGYIRYGVNDPNALILMTSGIRSRRLAQTIAQDLADDLPSNPDSLRNFLAPMGVAGWRARYTATASEILDLLEFARLRRRSLLRALLENGTVALALPEVSRGGPFRRLVVEPQRDTPEPAPLAVYDGDERITTIAAQDHADVNQILETGLGTGLAINADADGPTLTITLTLRDSG
jgi:superfamily II DNA/RNA helicase